MKANHRVDNHVEDSPRIEKIMRNNHMVDIHVRDNLMKNHHSKTQNHMVNIFHFPNILSYNINIGELKSIRLTNLMINFTGLRPVSPL